MTNDNSGPRSADSAPLVAWGGLLIVEAVGLSLGFDFEVLNQGLTDAPWWQPIVLHAAQVPRVAAAAAVAAIVHGGWTWKDEITRLARELRVAHRVLTCLVPHVLALLLFIWLTARLTGLDVSGRSTGNNALVVSWGASALAVVLTWLAIALPPREWIALARRRSGSLVIGLAVGLLAGVAGAATSRLWQPMAGATLFLVRSMIAPLVGNDLVSDPDHSIVGTRNFSVEIAPQCSGYEGIGLVWVILGAYLWLFRRDLRFPAALMLLPIGTALIWLANAVRIAALVAIGTWVSPRIAAGGFHSQAGWLALNGVILGLIAGSRRSGWITRSVKEPESQIENPSAPYLVPLMTLVATMMVGSALSDGFDRLYGLRVIALIAALWVFRSSYRAIRFTLSPISLGLGIAVLALWLALEPASSSSGTTLAANIAALSPWSRISWITARVVGSTLLVPFAEELAFRGYLARRLITAEFEQVDPKRLTIISIVVSSVLFGAMHQRFIAGALAGLVYALAYRRRGSLGDAILAHATTNGLIAGLVVVGGWWSLWS